MKKDAPLVVVIDGQGGMIGRKLCDPLLEGKPDLSLLALGTNSAATSAMLKGKAKQGATGENPVLVAARRACLLYTSNAACRVTRKPMTMRRLCMKWFGRKPIFGSPRG